MMSFTCLTCLKSYPARRLRLHGGKTHLQARKANGIWNPTRPKKNPIDEPKNCPLCNSGLFHQNLCRRELNFDHTLPDMEAGKMSLNRPAYLQRKGFLKKLCNRHYVLSGGAGAPGRRGAGGACSVPGPSTCPTSCPPTCTSTLRHVHLDTIRRERLDKALEGLEKNSTLSVPRLLGLRILSDSDSEADPNPDPNPIRILSDFPDILVTSVGVSHFSDSESAQIAAPRLQRRTVPEHVHLDIPEDHGSCNPRNSSKKDCDK